MSKTDEFAPPPAPSWETKFGLFVDFGGLFSHRFFDCRFGRFPGRILSGFGEVFGGIFEYFFVNCRCEAEAAKSHSTLLFTVV